MSGYKTRFTAETEKAIERSFNNTKEAHELLELIVAEFNSDPMSVQCFDASIVMRAQACVSERIELADKLGSLL